jgi:hypothetical protein
MKVWVGERPFAGNVIQQLPDFNRLKVPEQKVEIFSESIYIPDFQDMMEVGQRLIRDSMVEREDSLLSGKGD